MDADKEFPIRFIRAIRGKILRSPLRKDQVEEW
jgi:hypothetical protein